MPGRMRKGISKTLLREGGICGGIGMEKEKGRELAEEVRGRDGNRQRQARELGVKGSCRQELVERKRQ